MPSQKNKAHKPGRRAGKSAREKHQQIKGAPRKGVQNSGTATHNKYERHNMAKQQRENKRNEKLNQKRTSGAPRIITVLPLSQEVDVPAFWTKLIQSCRGSSSALESGFDLRPITLSLPSNQKSKVTWVPPPQNLSNPLNIVDIARYTEGVLLLFPETGQIDESGELCLNILRHNGLPTLIPVAIPPSSSPLKVRAASKKLTNLALQNQGFTEQKVNLADNDSDFQQLLRHISDTTFKQPLWKQQRPNLLIESADFSPQTNDVGTLNLRGFVRSMGLSANRAIHISSIGDFLIEKIIMHRLENSQNEAQASGDVRMEDGNPNNAFEVLPSSEDQDGLERENVPNPLDAEQTWPTEEEMNEADERTRLLPKGTSAYQATWIVDNEFSDEELEEIDLKTEKQSQANSLAGDLAGEIEDEFEDDEMNDAGTSYANDEEDYGSKSEKKPTLRDQNEDLKFPDEMDTPDDIPAKQRFAKYRGLKSFRASPWDPKESLPPEYAKIFAFQNWKRAEKRAKRDAIQAGLIGDVNSVPANSYIEIYVANVSSKQAEIIMQRVELAKQGQASPLVAFGLLQHETKLSVLNFSIKKLSGLETPIANKEKLLFVTGFRSYHTTPVFSTDEPGASKFKMERFLQPGQNSVATIFAPISYPPLPLLAFKQDESSQQYTLVGTGALKSCNPDRVVLKRIVLSGYPVKVTKKKAVVRWMFHNPDDVRWFRPLDLWTKHGLRGRIKEPVGTHGAMKCVFDGGVTQQDAVCTSLYKRIFPKWPESTAFVM